MLKKEFQFYLDNQADFVKEYLNKYLVIKGAEIIGVYNSIEEAYIEPQKEHELGTFLIQLCQEGTDSYTQTFHSRVTFA